VGPNHAATHAFVVTTKKPPEFVEDDEQKAMLGFDHEDHAREAFHEHYDDKRHLGSITAMPMPEFRKKVIGTRKAPVMLKAAVLFFKPQGHPRAS
jgi:hypothetical protein